MVRIDSKYSAMVYTSLPDQSADKTMPPPTASPAEKGSRPPTSWDFDNKSTCKTWQIFPFFLTLLVRRRHDKSKK